MHIVILVVFVVCVLLSFIAHNAPEPYRGYAGFPLAIAVVCLGLIVFGHI